MSTIPLVSTSGLGGCFGFESEHVHEFALLDGRGWVERRVGDVGRVDLVTGGLVTKVGLVLGEKIDSWLGFRWTKLTG